MGVEELRQKNNEVESIKPLIQELEQIKERELEKKEGYDPAIVGVDIFKLLPEDLEIYGKFKNKSLGQQEFLDWSHKIWDASKKEKESANYESRSLFAEWLTNKAVPMQVNQAKERIKEWKDQGAD